MDSKQVEYLIVGSGITGATIARRLFDAGKKVLVLERRQHVGGNMYDQEHKSGIRLHTYGPHYLRTNSERLWQFFNLFTEIHTYEATVKTSVNNTLYNWPLIREDLVSFTDSSWECAPIDTPNNFEEAMLSVLPGDIYRPFVRAYTLKQWGVDPRQLSPDLAKRIQIRMDSDKRLTTHRYQGIPLNGYAQLMKNLLKEIPVLTGVDYLKERSSFTAKSLLVFTGSIDEYFDFEFGHLEYRAQRREIVELPNVDRYQSCGQTNFPSSSDGDHVRTIEWKYLMPLDQLQNVTGTVITKETPFSPTDPRDYEYPFPDQKNRTLYEKYHSKARKQSNLLFCGRLGEYRYYDMDQACARAHMFADRILSGRPLFRQETTL
jgi:UDP-galactopyranose mutase